MDTEIKDRITYIYCTLFAIFLQHEGIERKLALQISAY